MCVGGSVRACVCVHLCMNLSGPAVPEVNV